MSKRSDNGLLPAGLVDSLPPEAEWEARVIERLMLLFASYGYARVKPPLIEFEESLLSGAGQALAPHMFRLMDPVSQRMLGVRPDMTLQVARIAATRLADLPRPLRLSYAGQVLHVRGTQLRPERQFAQVGVELIGSAALAADLEVVVMTARALADLGIDDVSIDLTQPLLVPAICRGLGFDAQKARAVRRALDQKDAAAIAAAAGADAALLRGVMEAAGPATATIAKLGRLALPAEARAMVDDLGRLIAEIAKVAPDLMLTADPGEFRGLEYQSGISFTLFAKGVRGELGRGGRYLADGDEPATGVTLYLDSVLRALPPAAQGQSIYLPADTADAAARRLRAEGWRAVQGLEPVADPRAEARRLGCSHVHVAGRIEELN